MTTEATGSGRSWRWVALLGALHLLLWMLLFFLYLDFSAVDDEPRGLVSQVASPFFWVVGLPLWPVGLWLQDAVFTGRGMPDALEWGLLLVNSLLWGIALEAILRRGRARA